MSTGTAHGRPLTDDGLVKLIAFGLVVGTPVLYILSVLLASVSGVGMRNAFAIAVIPALFGGVTFGGFVALMRHLLQEDRAVAAARAARGQVATIPAAGTGLPAAA